MTSGFVTIVSGLPRSGTSLMMQMLHAGGLPVVSDGRRAADADNPPGYFEFEPVKRLKEDSSWVASAKGKAFKAVSMLLHDLPPDLDYRVIFMLRDLGEILSSQTKMLRHRGTLRADESSDDEMRRHFEIHLGKIRDWLAQRPNFKVLWCHYREVVSHPAEQARAVAGFLETGLDEAAMIAAVDQNLYRNRGVSG